MAFHVHNFHSFFAWENQKGRKTMKALKKAFFIYIIFLFCWSKPAGERELGG